ncbi:MAG: zinc ribbon domain-containing protein [bacterium]|nr:zinc ribbon domain-containing protein [bacterium]
MPIYEYKCEDCGKVTEFFQQSWKQKEAPVCPDCGSRHLSRLISTPGIVGVSESPKGATCCGRAERCDTPPCSDDGVCRRD